MVETGFEAVLEAGMEALLEAQVEPVALEETDDDDDECSPFIDVSLLRHLRSLSDLANPFLKDLECKFCF